jgi:TonB family protein
VRRAISFSLACGLLAAAAGPASAQEPAPAPEAAPVPPVLEGFVAAAYPPEAAAAGQGASVLLRLQVSDTGVVEAAEIVESAGAAFDAAAQVAALAFRFRPAVVGGVPTRVRILYRYQFVPPEKPPTVGLLEGVVRVRGDAGGAAGISVSLDDGNSVITEADGSFRFADVAPGTHRLTFSGPGRTPMQVEESLEAGQRTQATYELEPVPAAAGAGEGGDAESDDLEIFVRAPAVRREAVVTQVEADAARKLPGTQGDVLKVVEAMPGVARATSGTGALIVWGAAPDETRVYYDDVPLPRLYHDGGVRSVVGSDLVARVDLAPGAYGAAYGRGLGGLVRVEGVALEEAGDRLHASAAADVFDASVGARGPLGRNVFLGGTARLGYLDRLVDLALSPEERGLVPAPRSEDAQLRLAVVPGEGQRLELFGLHSSDLSTRRVTSRDPERALRERRETRFDRVAARYRANAGEGAKLSLTAYWGRDAESAEDAVGPVETSLSRDGALAGLRAALTQRPLPWVSVETGLDLEFTDADLARQGALTQPPREGDARVFGQPPPVQIAADDWAVRQVGLAPYASADLAFFDDALHVEPGLRLDPTVRETNRRDPAEGDTPKIGLRRHDVVVEPRLSLRWAPVEQWRFVLAGGRYHQPAPDRDLSAVSGNPTLPPAEADHALFGATWQPVPEFGVETALFGRWSSSLPVRTADPNPASARALVADGEGRARGAQLMVRAQEGETFVAWVSYALSRSERRDAKGNPWRLADQDQTHVLTAVGSVTPWGALTFGTRVRLSSGFPETPVEGAWYDATRDRYEPVFGSVNSARRPLFFQWDLRASRKFELEGAGALEISAEVQNVTNRENVETWVYSPDYQSRRALTGLRVLPYLGMRWSL